MSYEWGPSKYGITLRVIGESDVLSEEETRSLRTSICTVDVEDDERGNFVGVGLYGGGGVVYYFRHLGSELRSLLTSVRLVGHNVKYDLHQLRKWGINVSVRNIVYDTRLAFYVTDSSQPSVGLKDLAEKYLGITYPHYSDIVTGKGKKKLTLDKQPVELVANYNAMDCIATYRLWRFFERKLSAHQRLYLETLEMPTMRILYEMECRGIKVDVAYLGELNERWLAEVDAIKKKLIGMAGKEFNPNSPQQVKEVLLALGLKVKGTDKKHDLFPYRSHKFVKTLLEYKELAKLIGTYTKPLIERAMQDEGHRIYTTFKQNTITGRLSSSDPNLQNIPAKTEKGRQLRRAFVAKPGHVFVIADYSQIDLRALAHFSQEPAWMNAFNSDGDPHKLTAAAVFKVPLEEVTSEQRRTAKTLNFTMAYGSGPDNVAYEVGCSVKDAEAYIHSFWKGLASFSSWRAGIREACYRGRGIDTLLRRFIPIPHIRARDEFASARALREAVSYIGQGSPAEIMKRAMIRLRMAGYVPVLQVHDELIYEVSEDKAEVSTKVIQEAMVNAVKLRVPLAVSCGTGYTWAEKKG